MWLSEYFQKALAFSLAYLRTMARSAFDLVHDNVISKGQFGRFYWVSLLVCGFAYFYYFHETQQYVGDTSRVYWPCTPEDTLPFFTFFVLAEIASFILLLGAHLAGWGIVRIWSASAVVLGRNLKLEKSQSRPTARQRAQIISLRLYGQMWGWFPITLTIAIAISVFAHNRFQDVVVRCNQSQPRSLDSFEFLTIIMWPGLVVAFAAVVLTNWLLFRWKWNFQSAFILSLIFVFYVVAIAVSGPSDAFLADGLRKTPQTVISISNIIFQGKWP